MRPSSRIEYDSIALYASRSGNEGMWAITYQSPMKRRMSTSVAVGTVGAVWAQPHNASTPATTADGSFMSILTQETVVCYLPFFTVAVTEQFRTGHPEHAPALVPQSRGIAIRLAQMAHDRIASRIVVGQPVVGGACI